MSDFDFLLEEQIPHLMRYAAALTRDPDEADELVEDTIREALPTSANEEGGYPHLAVHDRTTVGQPVPSYLGAARRREQRSQGATDPVAARPSAR